MSGVARFKIKDLLGRSDTRQCDRELAFALKKLRLLVDQFERKLNLPRSSGGLADNSEPGAFDGVGWQSHIDDVEEVKELCTELEIGPLDPAPPAPDGRRFD